VLCLPKRTEAKCALLATDAVIRFLGVVTVDQVLLGRKMNSKNFRDHSYVCSESTAFWALEYGSQSAHKPWFRLFSVLKGAKLRATRTYSRREEDERHDEHGRIQNVVRLVALSEYLLLGIPRAMHDLLVDIITCCIPAHAVRAGEGAFVGETKATVDSNPGHR
jgi:hypothetical protein